MLSMSLIVYSTSSVYGRQASSKHLNKRRYTCSPNIARYQLQLFIKFHNFRMHYLHILRLGGHNSISRRGGGWSFCRGQIIYFNRARRRAENFAFYYMYRTVLEVKYFFHAKSARSYLFQKNSSSPRPWKLNDVIFVKVKLSRSHYCLSYPLEVVSRYRDLQRQVDENYLYLFNLRPTICKF